MRRVSSEESRWSLLHLNERMEGTARERADKREGEGAALGPLRKEGAKGEGVCPWTPSMYERMDGDQTGRRSERRVL